MYPAFFGYAVSYALRSHDFVVSVAPPRLLLCDSARRIVRDVYDGLREGKTDELRDCVVDVSFANLRTFGHHEQTPTGLWVAAHVHIYLFVVPLYFFGAARQNGDGYNLLSHL